MRIPLFDAHCDTASEIFKNNQRLFENNLRCDINRGMRFSPYAQVFAVFVDGAKESFQKISEQIFDKLLLELRANTDKIMLCKSSGELRLAAEKNMAAALISIEGAEQIGCDIARLRQAYDRGLRIINPVWNYDNAICGAALGKFAGGLTAHGAEFIKAALNLGVAVDLSHASESAFWDILELCSSYASSLSPRPVIASHSNSYALARHKRNLTDAQFSAMIVTGGAVGVTMAPDFLSESGADIYDVFRHIYHFLSLGGEKTVCLGGDLDGTDTLPHGFGGIQDYEKLYELLLRENLSEDLVRDIFYNNLLNTLEKIL